MWDFPLDSVTLTAGAFVAFPPFLGVGAAVKVGGAWVLIETGQAKGAAALAAGEAQGASGAALLGAYARGWQALGYLGLAAPGKFHARGFQATSVAGTIAAALIGAELAGLDEDRTVAAVGIARSRVTGDSSTGTTARAAAIVTAHSAGRKPRVAPSQPATSPPRDPPPNSRVRMAPVIRPSRSWGVIT